MKVRLRQPTPFLATLFLLLLSPVRTAADFPSFSVYQLTNEGQKAFETLLVAKQFEEGNVGYAANPSKLIAAYRVLLKEGKADEAFKSLLKEATPAGQLYALCGVYYTDHIFFLRMVDKHKLRTDYVTVVSGCEYGRTQASKIIELDAPNAVRLAYPEQSLSEWEDKNRELRKNGFLLDIVGGGYPSSFSRR